MNKFKTWLDATPKLAKKLTAILDVNETSISNVRNDNRPMPWRWMKVLARMSRGKLSVAYLMEWREGHHDRKVARSL